MNQTKLQNALDSGIQAILKPYNIMLYLHVTNPGGMEPIRLGLSKLVFSVAVFSSPSEYYKCHHCFTALFQAS